VFILSNEYVKNLILNSGQILEAFPFLYTYRQRVKPTQSCCGGQTKNDAETTAALDEVRRVIGLMPPADKAKLKQLLGVDRVRVYWTSGDPQNITRERADF
jgi:hypothetical protein